MMVDPRPAVSTLPLDPEERAKLRRIERVLGGDRLERLDRMLKNYDRWAWLGKRAPWFFVVVGGTVTGIVQFRDEVVELAKLVLKLKGG